jgi:hypothetical protein
MNVGMRYELSGHYHLQVLTSEGELSREYDFDNLITNTGLDFIASPPTFIIYGGSGRNLMGYCYLGTGTTTPAYTDTKLSVFGTAQSIYGQTSFTGTYIAGSPTIWQYVTTLTFSAGVATGTWSEIGIGPVSGVTSPTTEPSGAYLFSHALIVDGGGLPTTISVLSSEQLVVTYTLQLYITNTDVTYTPFLINTTSTSGTLRPSQVALVNSSFPIQGASGQTSFSVYSGSIGSITSVPSGTTVSSGLTSASSYSSGTYFISLSATWPTAGPLVGTWNSIVAGSFLGLYQFSVSPAVVIGSGASFSLTINVSWARH